MYFTDQLNRKIFIPTPPKRIISLVPSQTELLVDLGLEDRIVGVTKFCIHPSSLRKAKTIVGGTKNYRMDIIESLKPDLIIGNKEENEKEGVEELMEKYPVWMSDIYSVQDSMDMIQKLGEILGVQEKSKEIVDQLSVDFTTPLTKKGTCIYLIWNDPMMVVGKHTFIDEMLNFSGFENLIKEKRYPSLTDHDLEHLEPEFILLSSEPFPFKQKHLDEFQYKFPKAQVFLVDGEYFSWYGSRLLGAKKYFIETFEEE